MSRVASRTPIFLAGFEQFTKDITREHVLEALEEIDEIDGTGNMNLAR